MGTSCIDGTPWTQMWVATGRMGVTDRSASSGSCAVLSWVNRAPTRETRPPALASHAQTPPPLQTDRECQCRGGGFLSLTRDTRATMNACMNIDTRVGPLGLPARTGLLTAHCPRRFAYFPAGALLYARRFRGADVKPRVRRRGLRRPPHRCDQFRRQVRVSRV